MTIHMELVDGVLCDLTQSKYGLCALMEDNLIAVLIDETCKMKDFLWYVIYCFV